MVFFSYCRMKEVQNHKKNRFHPAPESVIARSRQVKVKSQVINPLNRESSRFQKIHAVWGEKK